MEDINPIKNPIEVNYNWHHFYLLLFLLALVLLLAILFFILKNKKRHKEIKQKPIKKEVVKIDTDLCIKKALAKLDLLSSKDPKKYSFQLSALLRDFLSCYYNKNIHSQTIREILSNEKIENKKYLKNVLRRLELIEFGAEPKKIDNAIKQEIKKFLNAFCKS